MWSVYSEMYLYSDREMCGVHVAQLVQGEKRIVGKSPVVVHLSGHVSGSWTHTHKHTHKHTHAAPTQAQMRERSRGSIRGSTELWRWKDIALSAQTQKHYAEFSFSLDPH